MPEIETLRRNVSAADCDFLGHMNVGRYFEACGDAIYALQNGLGLTRSDLTTGRRLSFAVVNTEGDFLSELVLGDIIYMTTATVNIGTKSATFRHRLYRGEDHKLCFRARFTCVMLDLVARRAVPVPDDVRARLADYFDEGEGT
ncbi:MAG: thioesterase family protein [Pseudomonadota bacterium]